MTKKILAGIFAVAFAAILPNCATAQTSPNWTYGYVPTQAQWNAEFASKQDYLGAPPLLTTGGTLSGPLISAASTTLGAGLNVPAGTPPTTPNDGDVWTTTSGMYVRINGVTIGPLGGATSSSFAATAPLTVSFPAGVTTYALTFAATLVNSGGSLGVNLNNANTWTATQTFPNNSLTLAELATLGANTVIGSIAGGTPAALSKAQITTLCNTFTASLSGCVAAPVTATGKFLRDDDTWQVASGTGTVTSAAYVNGSGMNVTGTTPCVTTCTWTFNLASTLPAFTMGGTISGGGNQINNVVIGASTPLAGSFTSITGTDSLSFATANHSTGEIVAAFRDSSMVANDVIFQVVGRDESNYDRATLAFEYAGLNSVNNHGWLGLYSSDRTIVWDGNGYAGIGTGTNALTTKLQVNGPLALATPATKTSSYSQVDLDSSLIFNCSGTCTLTLLAASTMPGRFLYVKTIAAQSVISASSNVVPLTTGTAGTAILSASAGKWAKLQSDGTNWVVMAAN